MKKTIAWLCALMLCAACSTTTTNTTSDVATTSTEPTPKEAASAATGPQRISPRQYVNEKVAADAVIIELTRAAILVAGEPAVTLSDGVVSASDKKGGASSLMIAPLHEALGAAKCFAQPNTPLITLFADDDVSYRLLVEALYTAGQVDWECPDSESTSVSFGLVVQVKLMVAAPDGWDGFNISMPRLEIAAMDAGEPIADAPPEIPEANPSITLLANRGVVVVAEERVMSAIQGCEEAGPTVCPLSSGAPNKFALYELLLDLKQRHESETVITFAAEGDVTLGAVAELLHVVRTRRAGAGEGAPLETAEAFEDAAYSREPNHRGDALFPDIILAIHQ